MTLFLELALWFYIHIHRKHIHFHCAFVCFFNRYEYETVATHTNDADNFTVSSLCSPDTQNVFQQPVSGNVCVSEMDVGVL